MPVAHVFHIGVLGAVELVAGDADPLLDEHALGDTYWVRAAEEFTHLLFDWFYFIFTGASLHFTLMGERGYVARQWASEIDGMGVGAAPTTAR
ncbi:hypothetical protein GCM10011583_70340 [Streptomyces camponoticapitis]|uniref:Uncharacterized protein n=1 Tax=Streptomyces camponoticapitis TaxID=1616125 RepID=A0ABQ2EWH9_9ACTN|nr:hypothetical protein GCM10011583_70340 [Streptomyces camponoticapitis]